MRGGVTSYHGEESEERYPKKEYAKLAYDEVQRPAHPMMEGILPKYV